MRRVISHPPTRSATSAHHCHPSLAAPPRPAPPDTAGRQPIVSAAIVIYRPDDLRFRLHGAPIPGRPRVSSDSSARDRSYILACDSAPRRSSYFLPAYLRRGAPTAPNILRVLFFPRPLSPMRSRSRDEEDVFLRRKTKVGRKGGILNGRVNSRLESIESIAHGYGKSTW